MKTQPSTLAALALLLIITAALCQGCKKDDNLPWPLSELPPATQTGENTFGCLINGEPFVPGIYVWDPLSHKLLSSYDESNYGLQDNNRFYVQAVYRADSCFTSISFGLMPITSIGTYLSNQLDYYGVHSYIFTNESKGDYSLDTSTPHYITLVKLDTIKNIASGIFEMDLRNINDTSDVLQIRKGRFDVRYFPE